MADGNPFESLMTPARLEATRDAEFKAKYADANPWVRMAAEAGYNMRKAERASGKGLTAEDITAQRNENILQGAQSKYAELIKDGKMTADEAQAEVLQEAISGFAANGSWEQALALTQPLNTLRKQALERQKLKAEIAYTEVRPDVELEKAAAATTRAEVAQQLADLKVLVAEAKTGTEVAKLQAEIQRLQAMADYYSRKDAGGGGGGSGGDGSKPGDDSVFARKQRVATNELVLGSASAARLMSQIRTVGLDNPAALTKAGPIMTSLATIVESTKALMIGRALMNGEEYDPDKHANSYKRLIRDNVADQKLQSLTLDLAFAFARARDPGGRLSNQDVEKAIEIVSGSGSAQARLEVLEDAFNNMDRTTRAALKVKDSEGYGATKEAIEIYEEAVNEWKASAPKPKPKKGASAPDKDGWITLPNGTRIREKK